MELGRNDKCWCNSGKPIRQCHSMNKVEYGEFISAHKNKYQEKKCYAPAALKHECDGIIKAHTISISNGLTQIASNGHVLSSLIGMDKLIKNNYTRYFVPVGIKQASVFNGFCNKHDKELFSCFENKKFVATKEQCTALVYRSISREIYILEKNIEKSYSEIPNNHYTNTSYKSIILDAILDSHKKSLKIIEKIKSTIEKEILIKKYNNLEHLVIETDIASKIALSSCILLDHDFNGNPIERNSTLFKRSNFLAMNTISKENNNFIVFSYLKKSKLMNNFIKSFINQKSNNKTTFLINLFFGYSENIYLAPDWWDILSTEQQQRLLYLCNFHQNEPKSTSKIILNDDRIKFDSFIIKNIKTV